ncbi:beta-propeller fold lactonase family protein [Lentisphaera marina]|uniref:lactonase family protein n=1 Tax=Lentisphaera marina TaxID=1111041 RepID=UPI0023657F2C|nr:beta-propeller fold lactonase family protein [Lentisphaera marina]MDD7986159.1 beta-propeller fold lactonase family protein [Lentisphaera marina]
MPILAEQFVYLSSKGDKKIEVYQLLENGELTFKQSAMSKAAPGNSVMAPNKKFLYVSVKDKKNCGIETFQINDDGTLKSVAYAKTPYFCGFLAIDRHGQYLFASHYSDGRVTSYQLENHLYKGQVLDDLKTDDRAHSIGIDKTGSFVYAPHTSPNKIYQFSFKNERLSFLSPKASMGPHTDKQYHEPRHFVFHPFKNLLYSSNEKGGGISLWSRSKTGQLNLVQTVSTLPEKSDRRFSASDIRHKC